MCGRCEGDPYRGVKALFNGDLQNANKFQDREDWVVISNKLIVYLGASSFAREENFLFRGCDTATKELSEDERTYLGTLAFELSRPAFGPV